MSAKANRVPIKVEKLHRTHRVEEFDCGQPALNRFLVRYALQNQLANASQTYVAVRDERVLGFYTLVVGQVEHAAAPERVKKGLAKYPVPILLLARLAVDSRAQGLGLGAALLRDAMLRTMNAADIAGVRAFCVHAKDERARAFYEHFGFEPSPVDPLHLFLLVKDLRALSATDSVP